MQIGNRFRCYPTDAQAHTLAQWIGCQRFIYNAKVQEDRYYRRFKRKALAVVSEPIPVDQQYSRYKDRELTPWLFDVPSVVLRNGATRFASAYQRFFKGLGGRPTIKKKHGKQSVWLTSELFEFMPIVDNASGEISHYRLLIGSKTHPLGELRFKAHKCFEPPQSLVIAHDAGHWFLSFSYDNAQPEPSEADCLDHLRALSDSELAAATVGIDRGIKIPLATSDHQVYDFSTIQKQRLAHKERYLRRWQRRGARRTQGGANRRKANSVVARAKRYQKHVRHDVAHKASHNLVNTEKHLFVIEALNIRVMTARAKPKQDSKGTYLSNNRQAKAGLNRSILSSAWHSTITYLAYKTARKGKRLVSVPAAYSSQTCSRCGYTHQDNRAHQALFVCQVCGHTDNADFQAADVIKARGMALVRSEAYTPKKRKTVAFLGHKGHARRGRAEVTPGKSMVSRDRGQSAIALRSSNQERLLATVETPTTPPLGG